MTGQATATDRTIRRTQKPRAAPPLRWLVGAGFVGRGLTYALIAVIAADLALSDGHAPAAPNQQGALSIIAQAPLGRVALIAIAVGLLSYALWKLFLGVRGSGPEGGGGHELLDRAANLGGGLVYLSFCAVAVRIIVHSSGNQSQEQRKATSGVLGWPGGHWLIAAAGIGLIAISLYQLYRGVSGGFADDNKTAEMDEQHRRVFLLVGRIGQSARALVFVLTGYFLLRTAIDFKPSRSVGIDATLEQLRHLSYGPWLLGLVAVGLMLFAVFSLYEARYQRL